MSSAKHRSHINANRRVAHAAINAEQSFVNVPKHLRTPLAVIDGFLDRYSREVEYYDSIARGCASRLDEVLKQNGVRAIVTHRAKSPVRLRDKLHKRLYGRDRAGEPLYRTAEDVRDDIVDLAGVRAALYFPGDRSHINDFIGRNFVVLETRHFPSSEAPPRPGAPIFAGYVASHYRVGWVQSDEHKGYKKPPSVVEIQVASVLMHAWSEIEHDLVYKPFNGSLSSEEYALLDQVNGLVLSSETALRLLQEAIAGRLANDDTAHFGDESELLAFLKTRIFGATQLLKSDKLGMLLIALRITANSKPACLLDLATSVALPWKIHPVSQLLNQTLLETPSSVNGIIMTICRDVWRIQDSEIEASLSALVSLWVKTIRQRVGTVKLAKFREWRTSKGDMLNPEKAEGWIDSLLDPARKPTMKALTSLTNKYL